MDNRNMAVWRFCLVLSVLLISSGAIGQQQSAFFNDSDNINVVNRWSSADDPSNGAVTDYNGDGFKDLFIPFRGTTRIGEVLEGQSIQGHRPIFNSIAPILFEGSGVNPGCTGIVFADFNNDGYSDFYAPNIGGHQLFKFNPTTGKYEDIAGSISTPGGFNSTISGSWGDFNADGWIDLLLLKYSDTYQNVLPYSNEQRLLINNGGQGFTLVGAVDTGIDNVTTGIVNALWCDFSGDGYVDLALIQGVNYPNASSKYFKNEWSSGPQGRLMSFVETPEMVLSYNKLTWNGNTAAAADVNNDGALDVLFNSANDYGVILTDTTDPNSSLPFAVERAGGGYGGQNPPQTWNIGALDYDLDGNIDFLGTRYDNNRKTAVFVNQPALTRPFVHTNVIEDFGLWNQDDRGLCLADFSNDGYTDVFLSRSQAGIGSNAFYYTGRPVDYNYRDWIGIQLFAPGTDPQPSDLWYCNYDCIGATVTIHAGDHVQAQTVDGGSGRARQADRSLIFGLGDYGSDTVDFIEVTLPNGQQMRFYDLEINETHKIPVNGVELVSGSMSFEIEHNEDDTQDWIVTWRTDGITDSSQDKVLFGVTSGDEIETLENLAPVSHGQSLSLIGVSSVVRSGSDYVHTVRLDDVICEPNRLIYCLLWSSSGSYTLQHQFPIKKILYCVVSN